MKTIWYYITYPIRLLLKNKVESAKLDLAQLEYFRDRTIPKARRMGATFRQLGFMFSDHIKCIRLKRFINNWSL